MTDSPHPWLQFLAAQGAGIDADQSGAVLGFDRVEDGDALGAAAAGFVAPLTDLGLIEARGDDAPSFLHNQLTNDVEHLDTGAARRAGYCSPKGRLLASFLIWKTGDAILLQLPHVLQPAVQKRLQMFVLRAKVKLADAGMQRVALGIGGAGGGAALAAWFPQLPAAPMAKVDTAAGTLIRLPDAFGAARYQWIAPLDLAIQAWPALSRTLTPGSTQVWQLADIRAAVPQIVAATQEQFVPQMVNFELVDGVNFKKGCYPGQEIVARSQYLGKLKRRMLPAVLDTGKVAPGMEIYSSADPEQPCGMVVNVVPAPGGGSEALVEIKLAAVEAGSVHLGSASGPALRFLPLPYALP
jgi:folate-binding protein YgfZ